MPELAEVEYYRSQWNPGIGDRVVKVSLHAKKRIFRGTNIRTVAPGLTGARLLRSEARGKRMLFRFENDQWLGLHLGMTGKMWIEPADFHPGKHEHFVLFQKSRALVFRDARQFGRVQYHRGKTAPAWWSESDPPEIVSAKFNRAFFDRFLARHGKAPIKAVLLMQAGFSGVGNWVADEILWRARVLPSHRAGKLNDKQRALLFRATKFVAREALRIIGKDFSDPPRTWLLHERWNNKGKCPRDGTTLKRATIGGRTTAWCGQCQH